MRGTLPPPFKRDATIDEVAHHIGGGYHKIVPEFLNVRSPDDTIDRGLGVYRLRGMAYRPELVGVDREVKKEGDATFVTYHTPVGSVSCKILHTEEMKRAGASITWISEPVIKEAKDYRVVGHIFKKIKIHPDYDNYREFRDKVGDKGYAAAFNNIASGPMHHIMKEFLDATRFYLELYDHPRELRQLSEDMAPYYDQIGRVLADSPAEVVFGGGNYDEMITYPPFFKEHILPYLQKLADLLHSKGKLLQTHCDGENKGLLGLLAESGMDIAEAVCPQPMTKVTITDVKKVFKNKITIFGGIPSVVLLQESMPDKEFERRS